MPAARRASIRVRNAAVDDADRIAEIEVAAWQAAYRDQVPASFLASLPTTLRRRKRREREHLRALGDRERMLVVEDDHSVSGFACLGPVRDDPSHDRGELYSIYLAPGEWGRGLGRELMDQVLSSLRDLGFRDAILWTLSENDRARRFYERCGWSAEDVERRSLYRGVQLHEVRYWRCISRSTPAGLSAAG